MRDSSHSNGSKSLTPASRGTFSSSRSLAPDSISIRIAGPLAQVATFCPSRSRLCKGPGNDVDAARVSPQEASLGSDGVRARGGGHGCREGQRQLPVGAVGDGRPVGLDMAGAHDADEFLLGGLVDGIRALHRYAGRYRVDLDG